MTEPTGPPPGLQIERTELAWERSALGFLAVAAALVFHPAAPLIRGRLVLAVAAIALAIAVFGLARRRGRITVTTTPDGPASAPTPARSVAVIGASTVVLSVLIVLSMLLDR